MSAANMDGDLDALAIKAENPSAACSEASLSLLGCYTSGRCAGLDEQFEPIRLLLQDAADGRGDPLQSVPVAVETGASLQAPARVAAERWAPPNWPCRAP